MYGRRLQYLAVYAYLKFTNTRQREMFDCLSRAVARFADIKNANFGKECQISFV
jgi:hypothetical protein